MKQIKLLFALALTAISFQNVKAQCNAYILLSLDTVVTGQQLTITDNSSIPNPGHAIYSVNFGDGSSYTSDISTFRKQYENTGIYTLCVTVKDTLSSCVDSVCRDVVILDSKTSHSTCSTSISISQNGTNPNVTFNGESMTSSYDVTSCMWFFGDGTTSKKLNETHTYAGNGSYRVKFVMTSTTCFSVSTRTIVVNSAGLDPKNTCKASINGKDTSYSPTVQFKGTATTNSGFPIDYIWYFGDGTTNTTTLYPNHSYTRNGSYDVSLVMKTDSCFDSTFHTIFIDTNFCLNRIQHVVDDYDSCVIKFYRRDDGTTPSTANEYWVIEGDSIVLPVHDTISYAFEDNGSQTVYLSTDQTEYCTDVVSETINVIGCTECGRAIKGSVKYGGVKSQNSIIYLIGMDSNILSEVDTVHNNLPSPFVFREVCAGDYFVKAALDSTDPNYASYLPTYYGDVLTWDTASIVDISLMEFLTIHLVPGNNSGGPGFIAGSVLTGANKKEGDPIKGVMVYLTKPGGEAVTYTYSRGDGSFVFNNLAIGSYKLLVDIPGKGMTPFTIKLTEENPKQKGVQISVGSSDIVASIKGVLYADMSQQMTVFPNPAQHTVMVKMPLQNGTVEVINSLGQVVLKSAMNEQLSIDITGFENGVYLINFLSQNGFGSKTLIKF